MTTADRRGRHIDRAHAEAIAAAPDEYLNTVTWSSKDRLRSWLDYADTNDAPSYDCGDRCGFCVPDWWDRDQLRHRLEREAPRFTLADRLLAQVGVVLKLSR